MQTEDNKGIYCDLCGKKYDEKFTYYSFIADKISVDIGRLQNNLNPIYEKVERDYDIDVCDSCMKSMIEMMKEVINDRESKKVNNKVKNKDNWSSKYVYIRPSKGRNKRK